MQRSEIYKTPRPHEIELPRPGDLAEIRRSHCQGNDEAGLLVQVMGEPHFAYINCANCGIAVTTHIVEIYANYGPWMKTPGPWFYPIDWLKRIDPRDPVFYDRIKKYRWVMPTEDQIREANKA